MMYHTTLEARILAHVLHVLVPVDSDESNQDNNSSLPAETKKGISERFLSTKVRCSFSYVRYEVLSPFQCRQPTVHLTTVESHKKRRMVVLKRNTSKYEPPSPDPNSGTACQSVGRVRGVHQKRCAKLLKSWLCIGRGVDYEFIRAEYNLNHSKMYNECYVLQKQSLLLFSGYKIIWKTGTNS